jgi:5-methylcytosine-specific restriction endonuclease McrBC regulatory subunit McrC
VTAATTIVVPERGTAEISRAVWRGLSENEPFWHLVDREVLAVERLRAGGARLSGGCYVGRASITKDLAIEIREKVSGSLSALLQFAVGRDFRVEPHAGPSSEIGPLIALLIVHFVDAVRRYAGRGRRLHYRQLRLNGSLIGGRLDMTRTIRLRARGLRHLAAFEKQEVSFDVPVNRAVLAALQEIPRIAQLVELPENVVAKARSLALLFEDCRSADVIFGPRLEAARRSDALASAERDEDVADMLALATVLLSHESFDVGGSREGPSPRSWFLNLETLFERAVRECLGEVLAGVGTASSGRGAPMPIFVSRPDVYRANPDLVLRFGDGGILVGDVKYKAWDDVPAASDVYQLLVHAAAFGARRAFLVFPSEEFKMHPFGDAATGTELRLFGLDVRDLERQARLLLQGLGVASPGSTAPGLAAAATRVA